MAQHDITPTAQHASTFTGNVFIFQAFDIGDDVSLERIEESRVIRTIPVALAKYFKNYHIPLCVELPHPHASSTYMRSKINDFGVISLTYKVPFEGTFEQLRGQIEHIEARHQEQSVLDAHTIYRRIEPFIKQPRFFQLRTSYTLIQVDVEENSFIGNVQLKEQYGGVIASLLRFETENLSEYQKRDILEAAVGYYRGDLVIIDSEAAFIYDLEYEDTLDLFEFCNIQQLELRYFDRLLDKRLHQLYERGGRDQPSAGSFLTLGRKDPIGELNRLKVDVSVITEKLQSSIKLANEPYFTEIYAVLVDKLDLNNWRRSIDTKLGIIRDVISVYINRSDATREEILTILIVVLIFIELVIGLLQYLK